MKNQWSVQAPSCCDWFHLNWLLALRTKILHNIITEPPLTTVLHFKHRGPVKQKGARPNGKPMKRTSSSMSWLVPPRLVIGSDWEQGPKPSVQLWLQLSGAHWQQQSQPGWITSVIGSKTRSDQIDRGSCCTSVLQYSELTDRQTETEGT